MKFKSKLVEGGYDIDLKMIREVLERTLDAVNELTPTYQWTPSNLAAVKRNLQQAVNELKGTPNLVGVDT